MRRQTCGDKVAEAGWNVLFRVLPLSWLYAHGGAGASPDGWMRPNVFGMIWLRVLSRVYYHEELREGRIPMTPTEQEEQA